MNFISNRKKTCIIILLGIVFVLLFAQLLFSEGVIAHQRWIVESDIYGKVCDYEEDHEADRKAHRFLVLLAKNEEGVRIVQLNGLFWNIFVLSPAYESEPTTEFYNSLFLSVDSDFIEDDKLFIEYGASEVYSHVETFYSKGKWATGRDYIDGAMFRVTRKSQNPALWEAGGCELFKIIVRDKEGEIVDEIYCQ